jgi:hypothetical protein
LNQKVKCRQTVCCSRRTWTKACPGTSMENPIAKDGKSKMSQKGLKDEDPSMKKTVLLWTIILAFILFPYSKAYSTAADTDKRREPLEEEIWALEEAYF